MRATARLRCQDENGVPKILTDTFSASGTVGNTFEVFIYNTASCMPGDESVTVARHFFPVETKLFVLLTSSCGANPGQAPKEFMGLRWGTEMRRHRLVCRAL